MVDTQPTSRIAERGQGMWDVRRAETRRSRGKRIGRELLHTGKKQTPDWGGGSLPYMFGPTNCLQGVGL